MDPAILRTRPAACPEAAGSNVSHQGDPLWSPPTPMTGQETEPSVSSRTGSHNGQQESAAELHLTQRDGAAGARQQVPGP